MDTSIVTSVYGTAEAEYTIKKSRFIASLKEITSEDEALQFINETKKKYWDARHHCYAWQLGTSGLHQKSGDDGEPSGTAGRPMLEVLKKTGITNTIVIVTRYFGGIKLGASGLVRAYSHAVTLGLEAASIADYKPYIEARLCFAYTFMNTIERSLPTWGIITTNRDFAESVTFDLQIPEEEFPAFQNYLNDATAATAVLTKQDMITLPILRQK